MLNFSSVQPLSVLCLLKALPHRMIQKFTNLTETLNLIYNHCNVKQINFSIQSQNKTLSKNLKNTYMHITKSLCCILETNTIWYIVNQIYFNFKKDLLFFKESSRRLHKGFSGCYLCLPSPSLQNNPGWVGNSLKITLMWFYYWFLSVVLATSGCVILIPNLWPISWICTFRHKLPATMRTERAVLLIRPHLS